MKYTLDYMYLYGYIVCMKTTINIDDELLKTAMEIYNVSTKTAIIEMGLQELINIDKRKKLANLFGSEKNLKTPRRRQA